MDLCPSKRPLILQKIKEERGSCFNADIDQISKNNLGCTLIATFGTEGTRSAILTACFKEGTKVKTLNGEKNIQDITSNDFVLTSNGWEKVINPTQLEWNQNFVKVSGNYSFEDDIICTDNHEFLVLPKISEHRLNGSINHEIINNLIPEYKNFSEGKKSKYRNYIRNIEPLWVQAKDLTKKDYLLMKIDNSIQNCTAISWDSKARNNANKINEQIFIDNNFCELIGIWLAEGSINRNMFSFTISAQEEELKERIVYLMKDVFGLKDPYINNRENSSIVIQYTSADLRDFIYDIFEIKNYSELNQYNKYIPKKLKYIEPLKQLQIFKGWIIGDGTYRERTNQQWSGSKEAKRTTVSKQLCLDMIHILHRNYINPSIITEERPNKAKVYNLILSGAVAKKVGQIKYTNYNNVLKIDWEDRLGKDLPCVYNNELFMRCQVKNIEIIPNKKPEMVYCLMVPSQNFTVSGVIVHNCRGYRSKEYPDGIDVDTAQYLSSLIPSERGFLWPLEDVYYGNKDKERKPIKPFINEVDQYPNLFNIMCAVSGLVNKRSSHASGVIMFDEDPYQFGSFMRTPKGEVITAYDLHDCETVGLVKYDLLVTEIQDKIAQTIKFLQEDGEIEEDLTLREIYNKYLHPNVLPIEEDKYWNALHGGQILNCFQFDSDVGRQAVKKIKPSSILELADANGSNIGPYTLYR